MCVAGVSLNSPTMLGLALQKALARNGLATRLWRLLLDIRAHLVVITEIQTVW